MSTKESRPGAEAANQASVEIPLTIPARPDIARILDQLWAGDRQALDAFIASIASNERSWFVERTAGVGGVPPESPYEPGSDTDRAWCEGWTYRAVVSAIRADELAESDLAHFVRPTHEEMVARRIAEMEANAKSRGVPEWPGLENMTLAERRDSWRELRAGWDQPTTQLRGAA